MKIKYAPIFSKDVDNIINFIALDSVERALGFYNDLMAEIQKVGYMPYSFRKNLILHDESVRDLIFKGYVIPFRIDEKNQTIKILSIFKRNMPNF